uniref:Tail assembly chaperone n=1 Tax=Mycobacterium phage Farewell TaxID=3158893 RepID=A0AAU8GMS0_9CAUD
MTDIIDRIDELVDEQLGGGEPLNGYDFGDPTFPRCPHCHRHWHGLRITERVARMYERGQFDPEYTYAEDDSPVLCEGSEFIGPQRPPRPAARREIGVILVRVRPELNEFAAAMNQFREYLESAMREMISAINRDLFEYVLTHGRWSTTADDATRKPRPDCDVDITFGPQNWIHEILRIPPERQFPRPWPRFFNPAELAVRDHWHQFSAPNFPVPEAPGYDFSHYANDDHPTWALTADHNARAQPRPARTTTRQRRRGRSRR